MATEKKKTMRRRYAAANTLWSAIRYTLAIVTAVVPRTTIRRLSPVAARKSTKKYRRKNSCPMAPLACSAHDTQSVSPISTGASTYQAKRFWGARKERKMLLVSAAAIMNAQIGGTTASVRWKRRRYEAAMMNT